jgi:hypothetical protein
MKRRITRGIAIQIFCHECCGWDARRTPDGKSSVSYNAAGHEVSKCESKICPLWQYRNGAEEKESIPVEKGSRFSTTPLLSRSKSRQKDKEVVQHVQN